MKARTEQREREIRNAKRRAKRNSDTAVRVMSEMEVNIERALLILSKNGVPCFVEIKYQMPGETLNRLKIIKNT
jgi:hypothetical protein